MLDWYLEVNAVFRAMRQKAIDAQGLLAGDDKAGAKLVNGYLKTDYQLLRKLWTEAGFPEQDMGNLGRHIGFGDANDYNDILARDLPQVEARAEAHVRMCAAVRGRSQALGSKNYYIQSSSRMLSSTM